MDQRDPAPSLRESVMRDLGATELRAWRAFLVSHAIIRRNLETELLERSGLPLAEYDVLIQLALSDGRRLRMHELADRVLLSRGGLTRLVDRLVGEGLVERAKCGLDARGAYAVLTETGMDRVQSASPCHLDGVKRFFTDHFDADEQERLAVLLERTIAPAPAGPSLSVAPADTATSTPGDPAGGTSARTPTREPSTAGA